MATESWGTDPSLETSLFEEGYRFDFFQAVRLLEGLHPERSPIGVDVVPSNEAIRFRAHNSLSFPPSSIYEIAKSKTDPARAEMTVAFMGLTGPSGVLPMHYTVRVLERLRENDETLSDFFDVFNHRLITLFYRAWEKYRVLVAHERALAKGQTDDSFTRKLYSLIGLGSEGLRGRTDVDSVLLFHAGLLAQRPHSAMAMESTLKNYFQAPFKVWQFLGAWLDISRADQTRIGAHGANHKLGDGAIIGRRAWDQQAKFRVRIGPLLFAQFLRFVPSGNAFRPLVQIVRFIVGQEADFDVQTVVAAAEVPYCRLGMSHQPTPQLGYSAWLKSKALRKDAEEAIFSEHLTRMAM
jgi:type VI secretion system protein ImpH